VSRCFSQISPFPPRSLSSLLLLLTPLPSLRPFPHNDQQHGRKPRVDQSQGRTHPARAHGIHHGNDYRREDRTKLASKQVIGRCGDGLLPGLDVDHQDGQHLEREREAVSENEDFYDGSGEAALGGHDPAVGDEEGPCEEEYRKGDW